MSPTPNDARRQSNNNPAAILDRLIDLVSTQVSQNFSSKQDLRGDPRFRARATHQVLSQHLAVELSNRAPGDIMISGGTSLMLRAPNARITEDIDIITRFYPSKEKLDQLCRSMSEDPNDPFTYRCRFKDTVKSRPGNSFEIDVYLNGRYKSTVKMDAVEARGSELGKDGRFNNEAVEKLQVRDPLLASHRNNHELSTLQLLSPEKYLAGKIAGLFPIRGGELQKVKRWKDLRDIMILATNVPIDSDKLNDAFYDLMDDSNDRFVIPKPRHIADLLEQARRNRQFINQGDDVFYQADRFSVEAMVRVISDLILIYDENAMWDLKANNPQLQRFEAHKNLPRLSLPELEDLDFNGWRDKNNTDINKPPRMHDYESGTFKQISATTPRNTLPHVSVPDKGIPQQMVPTTEFGRLGAAVKLIEDPVALASQSGRNPWAQGTFSIDTLRALAGGEQPYTLSEQQDQHDQSGHNNQGSQFSTSEQNNNVSRNQPDESLIEKENLFPPQGLPVNQDNQVDQQTVQQRINPRDQENYNQQGLGK